MHSPTRQLVIHRRGPIECRVRVPATTTNFGPGFDTFGAALRLYNWTTLRIGGEASPGGLPRMVQEAAEAFAQEAGVRLPAFDWKISGDVPSARGLGSSATVRVGVLVGLNEIAGRPIPPERLIALGSALEGHPDNVCAALLGGFTIASDGGRTRVPLGKRLEFVAFIPESEMETEWARSVLPHTIPLRDAVWNLQRASRIAACVCLRRYEELTGLFEDRWHQPARVKRIAAWNRMRESAYGAGAVGFYLSGAGSTLMALATSRGADVAAAMARAAAEAGLKGSCLRIQGENRGAKAWLRTPRLLTPGGQKHGS
ncbi:Homoserine kinase [Methylacidimicrobium sp. AP8]|uniref:homoserine kinase n=1 Tax=Methylacidimicrobium sp. AP8 TaxID=2730359 RepID=UPI0018C10F9E|nr:homoserine kinase [Methylacidimicrobium sp. AP8]CAB4244672.1 Homoserine kinase [Methylacidimicrobium sp. AP8]